MTFVLQQVTVQKAPPLPPRADDIGARIEAAVERALSGAATGQGGAGGGQNTREGIREAVEAMRAEIEAARAQGVERITIQPQFGENMIPPQAVDISVAFFVMLAFVIVGLPLARAFARRMDRRGETASASEIAPRLDRIEQAVEAIAIEVERVSEGQRFTTKAIAELRGLPSANPAGWPAGAREAERVPAGETSRRP
jgi:hypothetical protein